MRKLEKPFGNVPILIEITKRNGHINIQTYGGYNEEWEPYFTASVVVNGLSPDEVGIKTYSENEGVYEYLLDCGIIEKSHRRVYSGFVVIPICELSELGKEILING